MNSWVNLTALWKIVVVGVLAGAGLPALFALGLRAMTLGESPEQARAASGGTAKIATGSSLGQVLAVACFAVVLAAIGYGIYLVVSG